MQHRFLAIGALLALAAPLAARAADGQWLPDGEPFAAPAAATIEALNYLSYVNFDSNASGSINIAMVAVGNDFGFYRRDDGHGGAWQLGLFAEFQSQFNMDTSNQALVNSDYYVGFPLSWQRDAWSARLRLFHQSSHLGDEFILSGEAPPRQDLSYEAADLLLGYALAPGWRAYAGGVWVLRKQWDELGALGAQGGIEYLAPARKVLRGHWLAALDVKWAEAFDNDPQLRALAGVRWGGERPGQPSATFALTGFYGAVPFGQFFETTSTYVGAILFLSVD